MAVNDTKGLIIGLITLWRLFVLLLVKLRLVEPKQRRRAKELDRVQALIQLVDQSKQKVATPPPAPAPPVVIVPSPTADEIRQVVEANYDIEVSSIVPRPDGAIIIVTFPFDVGMAFDSPEAEAQAMRNTVAGLMLTEKDIQVRGHQILLSGLRLDGPAYHIGEQS